MLITQFRNAPTLSNTHDLLRDEIIINYVIYSLAYGENIATAWSKLKYIHKTINFSILDKFIIKKYDIWISLEFV